MGNRQELAQRLSDWLRERNWAPRRLSVEAGLAENAVGRILERPERETQIETWRKLARYLGWDEREVLDLAGFGTPREQADDPWMHLEAAMSGFSLEEEFREHLRRQVQFLLDARRARAGRRASE
jgi:hypothetical protein